MKATVTLLLVCTAMTAAPVIAQDAESQDADYRSAYLGLGITKSRIATQIRSGISANELELSDRPTGIVGYGGYRFSPYIALEAGISLSGTAKEDWSNANGTVASETDIRMISFTGLFFWPISTRFEIFGKIGGALTDTSVTTSFDDGSNSARNRLSDQEVGFLVGGGFGLPFGNFAVRFDVDLLSYNPTSEGDFMGTPVSIELDDPLSYSLRFQGNF